MKVEMVVEMYFRLIWCQFTQVDMEEFVVFLLLDKIVNIC